MIIEQITDERVLHYSDKGVMLRKVETGELYEDVLDYVPCIYTYEETDIPIETELTAEQALDILLGGDGNAETSSY